MKTQIPVCFKLYHKDETDSQEKHKSCWSSTPRGRNQIQCHKTKPGFALLTFPHCPWPRTKHSHLQRHHYLYVFFSLSEENNERQLFSTQAILFFIFLIAPGQLTRNDISWVLSIFQESRLVLCTCYAA